MFAIASLGFTAPWLLWALAGLPVLWLLLRAVPPAPLRRRFPGVALLIGLTDEESEADRTPWWLLALRLVALAAAITGFAGPVLNPAPQPAGRGPLLVVLDGGWAEARDWPQRLARAQAIMAEAEQDGRPVAAIRLTDAPQEVAFQEAGAWAGRLAAMQPAPWAPDAAADWVARLPAGRFDTIWLADGLDHPGRATLAGALRARGGLRVIEGAAPVLALHPPRFEEGWIRLAARRLPATGAAALEVAGIGPDPAGITRELARARLDFAPGAARAEAVLDLPPEIRNRLSRFEIAGLRSAGAVSLADDSLKRRKVALIGAGPAREGLQLLSPLHYLRQALAPEAELIEVPLDDALPAAPDVVILADVARLTADEHRALAAWVAKGGLLLRFAGPRTAAAGAAEFGGDDPLMPVRLREGGRSIGGAMSWGEPRRLAPFPENSPFHGLPLPSDLQVARQVLAQPDPELAERTIAALEDGTPLVTRRRLGEGQVVLFHVTANAEWSNLPLSGLFPQMLERLAVTTRSPAPQDPALAGQVWVPRLLLDAHGAERDPGAMAGIAGDTLAAAMAGDPGPQAPPGLYAGAERLLALNVIGPKTELAAARWPAGVTVEGLEAPARQSLAGALLAAAAGLMLADILAALWLAGRLAGRLGAPRRRLAVLALALALLPGLPGAPGAETPAPAAALPGDGFAIAATRGIALAHVLTGDARLDAMAAEGLAGLGERLAERTAVEPLEPVGVDVEKDELAFFPFLYWPVSADAPAPSPAALAKLNQFLRSGGLILFDTRDGDTAATGATTAEGEALQRIAAGLDIPPLEPIPPDHVLTRTFYLIRDFPGRQTGATLWVEAAAPDAEQQEGMPFRNLNDGVTPVVIGGNDWAAAWAMDANGMALYPVGRGAGGEQQREMAFRFGINLIMHVLTGNYKSDQVHVPALLERLGQ